MCCVCVGLWCTCVEVVLCGWCVFVVGGVDVVVVVVVVIVVGP